jgi:cysteine-rich repeat protein
LRRSHEKLRVYLPNEGLIAQKIYTQVDASLALFGKNRQHGSMRSFFFLCCLFASQTFAQTLPTSQPIDVARPLQKIICGDGVVDAGEDCDDGNTIDNDACSNVCVIQQNQMADSELVPNSMPQKKTIYDADAFVNPVLGDGPYYRSPKLAFWLSAVPTVASFAGLYTTLIYRGINKEDATSALTASLAGVSITPSVGMLYAQKPGLAFGLMAARGAASGLFALGLALHREDINQEDELDGKLLGFGMSTFTILALMEVLSTTNAAKQSHPPGTPKPATIIKQ